MLPKDVQFTQEAAEDLHNARQKALINLGLIKLLNIFDSWEDFDDYRKVCTLETLNFKSVNETLVWKLLSSNFMRCCWFYPSRNFKNVFEFAV